MIQRVGHWGLLATVLLGACSGGDGGNSGGSGAGADRALAQLDCYVGLQVPGVPHTGYACSGTETLSTVSGLQPEVFEVAVSITLMLAEAPAVGSLDVTSMSIDVVRDGTTESYDAPVGSCSFEAISSNFDAEFEWTYFRIDISCSEPALSEDSSATLELGDFTIVTFFTLAE